MTVALVAGAVVASTTSTGSLAEGSAAGESVLALDVLILSPPRARTVDIAITNTGANPIDRYDVLVNDGRGGMVKQDVISPQDRRHLDITADDSIAPGATAYVRAASFIGANELRVHLGSTLGTDFSIAATIGAPR